MFEIVRKASCPASWGEMASCGSDSWARAEASGAASSSTVARASISAPKIRVAEIGMAGPGRRLRVVDTKPALPVLVLVDRDPEHQGSGDPGRDVAEGSGNHSARIASAGAAVGVAGRAGDGSVHLDPERRQIG